MNTRGKYKRKKLKCLQFGIGKQPSKWKILPDISIKLNSNVSIKIKTKCSRDENVDVKWLKEGDSNSNYFHRLINYRRRQNVIQGLFINGVWVHDPRSVKSAGLHYFNCRFAEQNISRPTLDGVHFPSLPKREKESLVARFSEEENKSTV